MAWWHLALGPEQQDLASYSVLSCKAVAKTSVAPAIMRTAANIIACFRTIFSRQCHCQGELNVTALATARYSSSGPWILQWLGVLPICYRSCANVNLRKRLRCSRIDGGRLPGETMQTKHAELMNLDAVAKKAGVSTATVSRVLND